MNFFLSTLLFTSLVQSVASVEISKLIANLEVVFGVPSAAKNDALAGAKCPSGYQLVGCSIDNVEHSNGPFISGYCLAKTSTLAESDGVAIQAVATCAPESIVGVPLYMKSNYWLNPRPTCLVGYTMVACEIEAWHGEKYNGALPKGKIVNNRCVTAAPCREDSLCRASYICLKN